MEICRCCRRRCCCCWQRCSSCAEPHVQAEPPRPLKQTEQQLQLLPEGGVHCALLTPLLPGAQLPLAVAELAGRRRRLPTPQLLGARWPLAPGSAESWPHHHTSPPSFAAA